MKKFTLLFLLAFSYQCFAQNNSLNVFSQDGDPFFLIVNGVKQNPEPQTNVTADGLNKETLYKVKVVFADGVTPDADKSIFFEKDDQLMTTAIDKKMKDGKVKKVKLRYAGLTDKETNSNTTTATTHTNGTSHNHQNGTSTSGTYQGNSGHNSSTQTTTSTTSTTTQSNGEGGSVNVNMTDPETGENVSIGIDVNVSGSGSNTSTQTNSSNTTTTTTTTTSSSGSTSDYNDPANGYNDNVPTYVPGYSGNVGCDNALLNENEVKKALADESFSDDKMMVLKQATKTKCVSTGQVISFMEEFSFEKDQLEVAKFLYDKTYDQDNYFKVINELSFSASKKELNEYIDNSSSDNTGYNPDVPTYVPGYSGNVGCNNVLIDETAIKKAVAEESFSDDKIMVIKQATKTKCVSADQVLSLMGEFDFDKDKVEVAKYLYDKTYDQDNYFKVINSFDFSSSKNELNEYIEGR